MSNYPTYACTSIDRLVAEAKMELKIDHLNTQDFYLKRWAKEAAAEMGTKENFIDKEEILDINENHCACLPSDYIKLGVDDPCRPPLVINNYCSCNHSCGEECITTCTFVCTCCWNICDPVIQDGYIMFPNNVNAKKCKINYTALNLYSNGDIKIPENQTRGIVAYICYKYRKSEGMAQALWIDDKITWRDCKLAARGASKKLNPFERQRMMFLMNFSFDQLPNYNAYN